MKKLSALMLLSATMILASCGKPAESKPVDSEPASETTSQTESKPESAPTSASTPAPSTSASSTSSRPATSASTPAPSSPAASTSEQSSKTMTVAAVDLVEEGGVKYLKVTGEMSGYTAADNKFALGLRHKTDAEGGLTDALDGQWLVGSETPAAADYKYVPTVTNGSFEVKLSLAEITWVKGAYEMFVGPQGKYAKIDLQQADYGDGQFKTNGLKLLLRGDRDLIYAEELPPVVLTEAVTVVEGEGDAAKVFLKVGGELGGATAAEFQAMTVKVTCERQVGSWQKVEMEASKVTNVVEGTKGYVKIDITDLGIGGYQVKLGFDGASAPNTAMECDSYDMRETPTVLGDRAYAPYYAAGTNDADHLYGCCGLFVSEYIDPTLHLTHTWEDGEKVGNATPGKCVGYHCGQYSARLDIADATGFNTPNNPMGKDNNGVGLSSTWNLEGLVLPAGRYAVEMFAALNYTDHGDRTFQNMAKAGTETRTQYQDNETDDDYRYYMEVNGATVNPTETRAWGSNGIGLQQKARNSTSNHKVFTFVDEFTVDAPITSVKLAHSDTLGFELIISNIRLINLDNKKIMEAPKPDLDHTWADAAEKTGNVTIGSCSDEECTTYSARLDIADATGFNTPNNGFDGGKEAAWDVTGVTLPAGRYAVQMFAALNWSDHGDRRFYNMAKAGDETRTQYQDTVEGPDYRYTMEINGTTQNPTQTKAWGNGTADEPGCGMTQKRNNSTQNHKNITLIHEFTVDAPITSVKLAHPEGIGFELIISNVRLVNLDGAAITAAAAE